MSGEFTEVRGTAHDLQAWHALLTGDAAPFQRIEAVREAGGLPGGCAACCSTRSA